MSNYKITDALCDWISNAGGTPTEEDGKSITHAMRTLYYALGGEGEIPAEFANNIAVLIQGLSYVAGGGGGVAEGTVTSENDAAQLAIDIGMDSFKLLVVSAVDKPYGLGHGTPITVTIVPQGAYFAESRFNTNSNGTIPNGGSGYTTTDTPQYSQDGTVVTVKSVLGHWANITYKWFAVGA